MELPKIISVDDHVVEPPHVWQTWLPEKWRAAGPRVERRGIRKIDWTGAAVYKEEFDDSAPDKVDCWVYGDLVYTHKRMVAAVGYPVEEMTMTPITYDDMRPGCYDVKERLADMDANWTEASMCFPTFPRFCGQTFAEGKDKDLGLACVEAYNDWTVEEWCGESGGRLIPLCLVPLWDVELAAKEVRRNAARGVHAVAFSEMPFHLGLPTIHSGYWDPFFQACAETQTTVCMHIGSSSRMPATSADAPPAVTATLAFGNAMFSLIDFLFSGVLVRFPDLRLAYAESQVGWLPYTLERVDDVWHDNQGWAGTKQIPEPPSTYYYKQVFGCFFKDQHGMDSLDKVGVDNVTFETDYPHSDSTWPNTKQVAEKLLAGLPDEAVRKILRGNAIRMLHLEGFSA
ncbi:MAG TPA: amidohydrolase family protein [Mycobacteriales bacterium]|nr:amidohydrolase family protein [Mycobacteriales bacterium]